jgi:hypothetical protein
MYSFSSEQKTANTKHKQIACPNVTAQFDRDREVGTCSIFHAETGNVALTDAYITMQSAYAARASNEQLAHELLLDATLQLEHSQPGGASR